MRRVRFGLLLILALPGCSGFATSVDPDEFYAPKLRVVDSASFIAIDVEIEQRGTKSSFIHLFEHYGFSGNGPAIEQVVRENLSGERGRFDSEGDVFFYQASDGADLAAVAHQLRCIEDVKCLQTWIRNARWTLMKE
jgi:hypothetical protein